MKRLSLERMYYRGQVSTCRMSAVMSQQVKRSDSQWHVTAHLSEWLKYRDHIKCWWGYRKASPSVFVNDGNIKGTVVVESNLSGSHKTKCMLLQPPNCTLGHLSQRNGELWSQRNLMINVTAAFFTCNSQIRTLPWLRGWSTEQTMVHPSCGVLVSGEKKQDTETEQNRRTPKELSWANKVHLRRSHNV